MIPWRYLNFSGRVLCIGCVINMYCAISIAVNGSFLALFPGVMSMFCAVMTYSKRYQIYPQNEQRKRSE